MERREGEINEFCVVECMQNDWIGNLLANGVRTGIRAEGYRIIPRVCGGKSEEVIKEKKFDIPVGHGNQYFPLSLSPI